jgi:hypothetical protein
MSSLDLYTTHIFLRLWFSELLSTSVAPTESGLRVGNAEIGSKQLSPLRSHCDLFRLCFSFLPVSPVTVCLVANHYFASSKELRLPPKNRDIVPLILLDFQITSLHSSNIRKVPATAKLLSSSLHHHHTPSQPTAPLRQLHKVIICHCRDAVCYHTTQCARTTTHGSDDDKA